MPDTPVFRFAPSPNGRLHIGHAYSAFLNERLAKTIGGKLLLRIEDIDHVRCRTDLAAEMLEELDWLKIEFTNSPLKQSSRLDAHTSALLQLKEKGLVYPAFMSRSKIRTWISANQTPNRVWPTDPDGAPHYPPLDRAMSIHARKLHLLDFPDHAWRLDMERAMSELKTSLAWCEATSAQLEEFRPLPANPGLWGDVILSRKDIQNSYHLSCVVDDAFQGITHIVRGQDLFEATAIHRLLQTLLKLPQPKYFHHELIRNEVGEKLSKSKNHPSIADLRSEGWTPVAIRKRLGF